MTDSEAWRLRPGDELLLQGRVGPPGSGTVGYIRARLVQPFDGIHLVVAWESGFVQVLDTEQLPGVYRGIDPIDGIPREVLAFAAGINAAKRDTWRTIAVAVEVSGMGKYDSLALEVAVRIWTLQMTSKPRTTAEQEERITEALARTKRGGLPS